MLCSLCLLSSSWLQAQDFEWIDTTITHVYGSTQKQTYSNLIVDNNNNIFVLDETRTTVSKFNKSGVLLNSFSVVPPNNPISQTIVFAIKADSSGNIYTIEDQYSSYAEYIGLTKRDNAGNILWSKTWTTDIGVFPIGAIYVDAFEVDANGNTYIIGRYDSDDFDFDPNADSFKITTSNPNVVDETYLMKLDTDGNLVWAKPISFNFQTDDFNFIEAEMQLQVSPDNQFLYIGSGVDSNSTIPNTTSRPTESLNAIIQYDSAGNYNWMTTIDSLPAGYHASMFDMIVDYNSDIYISGLTEGANGGINPNLVTGLPAASFYKSYLIKINATGGYEWARVDHESQGTGFYTECNALAVDRSNSIYEIGDFSGSVFDADPSTAVHMVSMLNNSATFIRKYKANGDFEDIKFLVNANRSGTHSDIAVHDEQNGLYLLGGFSGTVDFDPSLNTQNYTNNSGNFKSFLLKLSTASFSITGNIYLDQNLDCNNSNEQGLRNTKVMAANAQDTFYSNTDALGNYQIAVRDGSYNVVALPQTPYLASICTPSQTVLVDTNNIIVNNIDFAFQSLADCPYMSVDISAPLIRNTTNNIYVVNYCNDGTADSYDSYVEITLDNQLTSFNSSIPVLSQAGNVYTFDLDTVLMGECGSFLIEFSTNSGVNIGQTVCSEAHIYPDSLCSTNWTGPIIQASATCQQDTVFFKLENNGTNMAAPLNYSIFEDHVMLRTVPFTLPSNGSTVVAQAAGPGKIYRLEAQQPANIPPHVAPPIAHTTVVGCNVFNGTILSVGIIPQFYTGNTVPWIDIDCQTVIGSYDPNDKTPQPLGYDAAHYIERGIPLDYKIRFQNTGLDSAFNIIVVDTLSPHLDVTTFQMKGSSHPYTWQLSQQGILTVSYIDIRLVDSFTNEPGSHGFFSYEIQQKPNLPLGTVIENTAAIYFDYNTPIFTNTTFHTIGENYVARLVLTTDKIMDNQITIKAFPNPFDQHTTIQVEGQDYETLTLKIVDVAGRVVRNQQVLNQSQIVLERRELNQGLYFYTIEGDGKLLGSGKLIAQ